MSIFYLHKFVKFISDKQLVIYNKNKFGDIIQVSKLIDYKLDKNKLIIFGKEYYIEKKTNNEASIIE
jgi:hypothetical protein